MKFFPLMFALMISGTSFANHFKVTVDGKEVQVSDKDIESLKKSNVTVTDPNESTPKKKAKITFKAYNGKDFLDKVFGGRGKWAESKKIVFECADHYKPTLDTKDFVKGNFFFAVERVGQKDNSIINHLKDGKRAEIAPFYIIWTDKDKQTKEAGHFWPYQVVAVAVEK